MRLSDRRDRAPLPAFVPRAGDGAAAFFRFVALTSPLAGDPG